LSEKEHWIEVLNNAVEGLTIESFIDVMTTASTINLAYKKLFPNSTTEKETYGKQWDNIQAVLVEEEKSGKAKT